MSGENGWLSVWSLVGAMVAMALGLWFAIPLANRPELRPGSPFHHRFWSDPDRPCGPAAAYVAARVVGLRTTLDDVARQIPVDGERLSEMGDLRRFLEGIGARTQVLRTNAAGLSRPRAGEAGILLYDRHFFVVEREGEDRLWLYNPPIKPRLVTPRDFPRSWDGIVLLVRRDRDFGPLE